MSRALLIFLMIGTVTAQVTFSGPTTVKGSVSTSNASPSGGSWLPGFPGASPGWFALTGTGTFNSACPADNTQFNSPNPVSFAWRSGGSHGCPDVFADWGGGAYDSNRNWLLIQGGGHGGYPGNEIYALKMTNPPTIARVSNPTAISKCNGAANPNTQPAAYLCGSSFEALDDGRPNTTHSYYTLCFDKANDVLCRFGGGLEGPGTNSDAIWKLAMSTSPLENGWTQLANSAIGSGSLSRDFGPSTAYDPNSHHVYVYDTINIWEYDIATQTASNVTSTLGFNTGDDLIYDPVNKALIVLGRTDYKKFTKNVGSAGCLLDSGFCTNWASTTTPPTGCSAIINAGYGFGLDLDTTRNKFVFYSGSGNDVVELDIGANSCATRTFGSNPCSSTTATNGVFGRWRYMPDYKAFVYWADDTTGACVWWP